MTFAGLGNHLFCEKLKYSSSADVAYPSFAVMLAGSEEIRWLSANRLPALSMASQCRNDINGCQYSEADNLFWRMTVAWRNVVVMQKVTLKMLMAWLIWKLISGMQSSLSYKYRRGWPSCR